VAEIVDGNGLAGHAVFIDLQAGVIIDPANKNTVPFDQSQLDKCAGPYSMCWGLRHVRQLTIGDGGGNKKRRRSRKKQDKKISDRKKQSRCEKPPPEQMDIQLHARSCVRADHPHDLQNFTEVFDNRGYNKQEYLVNPGRVPIDFHLKGGSLAGKTVLDCGAYVGFFALYALQKGAAKVICVEPNPVNFARLQENLAPFMDRVVLHQGAVVSSSQLSGCFFIKENGYRSRIVTEEGEDTATVVKNFSLSQLIDDHGCTFVKMDVEGAEADLLTDGSVQWGSVTHLVFEYTRSSGRTLDIQNALHAKTFSTHSWQPCQFDKLGEKVNNIDGILHCTRNPTSEQVLARVRGWGNIWPKDTRTTNVAAFMVAWKNGVKIRSVTFGYKGLHGDGIRVDTLAGKYCDDAKPIIEWGKTMLRPGFTFSDVIILKDSPCPVHADKNNLGESAMITLGTFTGGGLWVSDGEGGKVLECHNTVHYFDGKVPHATMPFDGERFTLVFYTRREVPSAKLAVRTELEELGFPLPPAGDRPDDVVTPEVVVKAAEQEFVAFKDTRAGMSKAVQWKLRRGVNLV
jgi:FkbM family methyltransferase